MPKTRSIPKEKGVEQGLSMLREGYMYISNWMENVQRK